MSVFLEVVLVFVVLFHLSFSKSSNLRVTDTEGVQRSGETREPVHGVMEFHSVTSIVDSSFLASSTLQFHMALSVLPAGWDLPTTNMLLAKVSEESSPICSQIPGLQWLLCSPQSAVMSSD